MSAIPFTCPRCLSALPVPARLRFCPRCGLEGAGEAAADAGPLDVVAGGRRFRVGERLAVGSVCAIYRCGIDRGGAEVEGVFKVARDARANEFLANEARVLRLLHAADAGGRFAPFLPTVETSIEVGGGAAEPARRANVLRTDAEIHSPDELYTLDEVRGQYPRGLDPRDVAWVWRRLLGVLGFVHACGVVHGAVLPGHVLIEPRGHRLVLVDWCWAGGAVEVLTGGYRAWYKAEGAPGRSPTAAVDVAFGARCMVELLGGDAAAGDVPESVEPGMRRHLTRCIGTDGRGVDAWKLLDEFDRLIAALWGPRRFRPLVLRPKGAAH